MRDALLTLIYGSVGVAAVAGGVIALAVYAAREGRHIEDSRHPPAGEAATDVGADQ